MSGYGSRYLLVIMALLVVGVLGFANLTGLLIIQSQHGFYGPVWHPDGGSIYFFERHSRGLIVGPGWEHFSPPAKVFLYEDRVSLVHYDLNTERSEYLLHFDVDPHLSRWTNRYHNRIFGWLTTQIKPAADRLDYKVSMSIPRVPSSERWVYQGTWHAEQSSTQGWTTAYPGNIASAGLVLLNGEELITVLNGESYGAAILRVRADNSYDAVLTTRDFSAEMVTGKYLIDKSWRDSIEKADRFKRVQSELVNRYSQAGLSEGDAMLKANDEMESMGLLARSPRIVASIIETRPTSEPVFSIPPNYFEVGLFQDIAAAINAPGLQVKSSTGDHLKYYEDDVGPRLKSFRRRNDSFFIESGGVVYRLDVQ